MTRALPARELGWAGHHLRLVHVAHLDDPVAAFALSVGPQTCTC
ncbi:MAG: hypothetical protein U1F77_03455 [Kiritimatiellia bacterium]